METRERFNLSRIAIEHPRITVAFWLGLCVCGWLAFRTLKYALLPDITFPVVVVTATAPSPQPTTETDRLVSRPLEEALKGLPGLNEIRASIQPSLATVTLTFAVGEDLDSCAQQVTNALQRAQLPAGTIATAAPLNLNQTSVATYALLAPAKSRAELDALAHTRIVQSLREIPGVRDVLVLGSKQTSDGRPTTISRYNGEDVLALDIIKQGDANTLAVADGVAAVLNRLSKDIPAVRFALARSQADYIREASHSTVEALLIAVALSVVVIFPFLWNWPATAISSLAIPTSLLGTTLLMAVCGFELDTITLLGLALVIGIIIDDAIVDVENIARHLEEGRESPREAALSATKEIGLTVTAATMTVVAVFLPVAFMKGSVGKFFKPFGMTVSAAVIISLLVARTLSPVLAAWWLRARPHPETRSSIWTWFVGRYRVVLDWSLAHPKSVVGLAALSLIAGIALIPFVPRGLIPRLNRGEFKIVYHLDPSSLAPTTGESIHPLELSREAAVRLEQFARSFTGVTAVYTLIGTREGDPTRGVLYVRLNESSRGRTVETEDQLRNTLPRLEGVTTSVEDVPFIELGDQKPIELALTGSEPSEVIRAASLLVGRLKREPGFVDVTSSANDAGPSDLLLQHLGTRPAVFISSNLGKGMSLGAATHRLTTIASETLPPEVTANLGGDSASVKEVYRSFGITLGLAVLSILGVLRLLFRNWVDPFVIVLALPLAIVGAVMGLLVVRSEFGMISLLGVVFLFGLVNKNAILLVDYINQLRAGGMDCGEAIRRAGALRLRPIMMTTAATIFGMLPVAIGVGVGSELRAPMAVAIIGGLITSTPLSLLFMPIVYSWLQGTDRGCGKQTG